MLPKIPSGLLEDSAAHIYFSQIRGRILLMPKVASSMFKILGNASLYYTARESNGAIKKTK